MAIYRLWPAAALALALTAGPVSAQEDGGTAGAGAAESTQAEPSIYIRERHGDWDIRCVRGDGDGDEQCHLYQLVLNAAGSALAELSLFALEPGGDAAAGMLVATPLDTYLKGGLQLSIDGAEQRVYGFNHCSPQGCFVREGLVQSDVELFRRGNRATMAIVPLGGGGQVVELGLSLSGFTAAWNALAPEGAN